MKLKLVASFMLVSLVFVGALSIENTKAQNINANDTKAKNVHPAPKIRITSDKAQKASAGTPDSHIKTDAAPNSANGENAPGPPRKGGQNGKGYGIGYVEVTFDNYTRLYVKCFVDGVYRGTIAPMGALTFATGNGATTLYARADFDDGSYSWWGPAEQHYYSGYRYTWKLNS
jgi:hypothetical protein